MTDRDFSNYVAGYVDGEGCFCISFNPRLKLTTGWEVRPSFSVSQNVDRAQVLVQIKDYFQCGSLRRDYSDKTLKYEIRSLAEIQRKIIPFFDQFPLLSDKQRDFELFKQICAMMGRNEHRHADGLQKIMSLASQMNSSGKRRYTLISEDIVSATRNSGEREVLTRMNGITT
jgi:hypothetical protein